MPITKATDVRYDRHSADWSLIHKMLTGEKVTSVLHRGAYEADRAFKKRKKMADWRPYTRDLVSRLVGELFGRSDEVERDVTASEEYRASVGPSGESYEVQLIQLTEALVAYHEVWAIMDPAQGLMIAEPQAVRRSTSEAIILKGTRTTGSSIEADEQAQDAWTVYYPGGYEVYVKSDDAGKEDELVDEGRYYENDEGWTFMRDGQPAPPAVQVTLPWRVRFGLAVARAHRALYRLESKYDAALTNSLQGLLQIATGGDDELKQAVTNALKKGAIAVEYHKGAGEHKGLNVGTEGLEPGRQAMTRKREELYRAAYQSLDQASTQMSATEAEQRARSGPAAAMSVLAEVVQSAEESILPLVAQAEDARNAGQELNEEVDWPTDYSGAYSDSGEQLVKAIFGTLSLPVGVEEATDAVVSYLQSEGQDPDRASVREAVQAKRDRAAQSPTDGPLVG